uniref:Uncharacterized protein n=1 Tax=Timema genevievae TaxID=629358 RepID=A0A7R9JS65_TIMGE|nr:unnamed protein product [Timema genevievae]
MDEILKTKYERVLKECDLKGNPIDQCERSVLPSFGHVEMMNVDDTLVNLTPRVVYSQELSHVIGRNKFNSWENLHVLLATIQAVSSSNQKLNCNWPRSNKPLVLLATIHAVSSSNQKLNCNWPGSNKLLVLLATIQAVSSSNQSQNVAPCQMIRECPATVFLVR